MALRLFPRANVPLLALALAAGGRAFATPPSQRTALAAPVEERASERRAVRGSALDDGGESAELRELRRFEEQAFPRGPLVPRPDGEADSAEPPSSLPGRWSGSGDLPPQLRSPETTPRALPAPADPDSEWLRALKLPDLPVRWDPQVLRYLDYFKNDPKGHAVMGNWLRRAGRYRELFDKTLERHGLPRDLFYVAMVESGFDTGARSRVGAGGIWQFMPGAARAYGMEVGYWVDNRRDPERSAEAAARYMKDLYVRFGSWPLVLAAYNAGYGAVLRSITRYNTNDFWELCRHEAGLPWESSIYVPKILAAAIVGHNQEAFGFPDVTLDPPFVFDRVEAPAGTAFATIARAAGTRPDVIQALNPQFFRDRVPPGRAGEGIRVPVGSAALYAEALEGARSAAGEQLDTVVLRFGETVDDVARARGLATRDLRRLNAVKDGGELRAGVTVLVPRPTAKDRSRAVVTDAPAQGPEREGGPLGDDQVIVAVPERIFSYEGRERVFYKTRDGDTLDEIGEAFGVKADDLVEWNNLDATARLHPNMVVQIFVRKDFDPASVVILDTARVRVVTLGSEEFLELEAARRGKKRLTYSCKVGDTLAKVGRRYGLTPGDLARINRFSYNTELRDGQRIVVYSPTGELPREATMGLTPPSKRGKAGPVVSSTAPATPGAASKTPAAGAAGTRPATITNPVGGGVRRPPVALKTADKPVPAKAAPVAGAASKAPSVVVSKPPSKKK